MPPCAHCQATKSKKDGRNSAGQQRFRCRTRRRTYTEPCASPLAGYRWPPEVITEGVEAAQAVWRGEVRHAGLGHGAAGQPAAADRVREVAATFTWLATTLGHAA